MSWSLYKSWLFHCLLHQVINSVVKIGVSKLLQKCVIDKAWVSRWLDNWARQFYQHGQYPAILTEHFFAWKHFFACSTERKSKVLLPIDTIDVIDLLFASYAHYHPSPLTLQHCLKPLNYRIDHGVINESSNNYILTKYKKKWFIQKSHNFYLIKYAIKWMLSTFGNLQWRNFWPLECSSLFSQSKL